MAVLTKTSLTSTSGVATAVVATASASDTYVYTKGAGELLDMDNTTVGSLTLNVKGSAPSAAYPVTGVGLPNSTQDLTAGLNIVVAAGAKKIVNLDKISAYLEGSGTITLSGAATLKLTIYA